MKIIIATFLALGISQFCWSNTEQSKIHFDKGIGVLVSHKYEEALREFEQALAEDPNNLVTIAAICKTEIYLDRYDDAIMAYERLYSLSVAGKGLAHTLSKENRQVIASQILTQLFPEKTDSAMMKPFIERYIQTKSESALPFELLGAYGINVQDSLAIARAADKLAFWKPNSAELLTLRAIVLIAKNNFNEARSLLDQALAIDPEYIYAKALDEGLKNQVATKPDSGLMKWFFNLIPLFLLPTIWRQTKGGAMRQAHLATELDRLETDKVIQQKAGRWEGDGQRLWTQYFNVLTRESFSLWFSANSFKYALIAGVGTALIGWTLMPGLIIGLAISSPRCYGLALLFAHRLGIGIGGLALLILAMLCAALYYFALPTLGWAIPPRIIALLQRGKPYLAPAFGAMIVGIFRSNSGQKREVTDE